MLPSFKPTRPSCQTSTYSAPAETPIQQSEAVTQLIAFPQILETPPPLNQSYDSSGVTWNRPLKAQAVDTPQSAGAEFAPNAPRRARPASYHGPVQGHGRTHSGGIRPLQLPIKVASATNSPRISSDVALPDVDDESPQTAPAMKTRFHIDDDVFGASGAHSSESFLPFSDSPTSNTAALSQAASRHRRHLSEQAFAQHEREALLARIAELEQALLEKQEHHDETPSHNHSTENPSYVELLGEMSTGPTTTDFEDNGCHSGYPSPPNSPPEAGRPTLVDELVLTQVEDRHSLRVLHGGSPTKPRLQLVSPTLFTTDNGEASSSSNERYLDGDIQVASPSDDA